MQFTESKLNAAIETAKAKAAGNRAVLNAIDKAAAGLRGAWIVTELHDGIMVTTESGETYKANGVCSCAAYRNGMVCKHRVAYRVVALYHSVEAAEPVATKSATRIIRSVERDYTGARVSVVRCNDWVI